MIALLFGLALVSATIGLMIADMHRKRRHMCGLLDRMQPLVTRKRRFALHNLRLGSRSMFYAQDLLESMDREISIAEREHGIEAQEEKRGRLSFLTGRRLNSMGLRVEVLESLSSTPQREQKPVSVGVT